MSPVTFNKTSEDKKPLIITEDTESPSNFSVKNIKLMALQSLHIDTSNPFASFDEVFYHGNNNNNNYDNNKNHKPASKNKKVKHYQSVGELLWYNGLIYSDVRLTFEDRGILATRAGIPSELRLHSLVLSQSQFFKEQLSVSASSPIPTSPSSMLKEKQIIVRLPSRVTEEDIINFYCTLKLLYTKNWDTELSNNLTKGVGCLSVCCEIGFHEGIEACWKWLVKKCNRDNNKEMMRRLIEAYPTLHEQFTEPEEKIISNSYLDIPLQRSSSKIKRTPPVSRRSSRRSNRARRRTNSNGSGSYARQSVSPMKSNRSDNSFSSDSSASPLFRYENDLLPPPPITLPPTLPSPPHSDNSPITPSNPKNNFPSLPSTFPPSIFNNTRTLNTWMSKFESYAISSKRACSKMSAGFRDDSKCFPFLEHFVSIFDSINQLGRAKRITSPEALDYTLRMLNVIKIEHTHFHTLHAQKNKSPKSPKYPKYQPSSPRSTSSRLSSQPSSPLNSNPPIVLHTSLDEPLAKIMKNVLAPLEQKHLCDYLWAPSNISNLMHLKEILSDDDDDMEEDEFNSYDQLMSEASLVKASRVSKVEHMIVGEKMAKYMREFRSNNNLSS